MNDLPQYWWVIPAFPVLVLISFLIVALIKQPKVKQKDMIVECKFGILISGFFIILAVIPYPKIDVFYLIIWSINILICVLRLRYDLKRKKEK